jgi:hypothetical protein
MQDALCFVVFSKKRFKNSLTKWVQKDMGSYFFGANAVFAERQVMEIFGFITSTRYRPFDRL